MIESALLARLVDAGGPVSAEFIRWLVTREEPVLAGAADVSWPVAPLPL